MLPRAALRSLRLRPAFAVPRTSPVTSTSPWIRSYASDKRRSTKPAKDNTWKPSDQIKFAESDKAIPVNPTEQPEFDTPAAPEQNTTPTEAPGPGVSEAQTPDAQQLYTKEQAEFVGPTSPEQNTDPTTEDPKHPTTVDPKQPQKPLPDLRYGIPSTFGDEFGTAESKAKEQEHDPNNITEDPAREPAPGGGGREGGELPKSAYETSTDRRRNRWANYSYIGALVSGVLGVVFLGRNWDDEADEKAHPDAPNGWSLPAMQKRITARFSNQMGYYTEPTFEKLLPEVEQRPPLTLVISLEDLLIHSEWTSKNGWRVAKRPGVDYFIRYLQQYYELVIWTSVKSMDADPIIRKLDPFRMIMWPLFREATRYEGGEYVKVSARAELSRMCTDYIRICRT
jgi:import inner membrane translocase subunit TIM50